MNTRKIEILKERIEQNYANFKEDTLKLDNKYIFELSAEITAVKEVYSYMTTEEWTDYDETAYLLNFENPLLLLADEWEECIKNGDKNFGYMLAEFVGNGNKNNITILDSDELREKYGNDIPLGSAAILELAEIGEKFLDIFGIKGYQDIDDE